MTDHLLPLHLRQAQSSIRYVDSVGISRGLYTGAVKTAVRGGDRLAAAVRFTPHGGKSTEDLAARAALRSWLTSLRGRGNRAYLLDTSYQRRGSMTTGELFANNTFVNGTTGWSSDHSLSASERICRATRTGNNSGNYLALYKSSVTGLTQYAPYALRAMINAGRGGGSTYAAIISDGTNSVVGTQGGDLLSTAALVSLGTSLSNSGMIEVSNPGAIAGDFVSVPYMSLSRCALVDGGINLFRRSDDFSITWATSSLSVTTNPAGSPDGNATGSSLVEGAAIDGAVAHYVTQSVTVPSAAADFAISVALQSNGRGWAFLRLIEGAGAQSATAWFNLATGAVGSTSASGGNWTNLRVFTQPLGSAWTLCTLVARKTNAATALSALIGPSTGDTVVNYTGNASSGVFAWRATLSQSAAPARLVSSAGAAVTSTAQGNGLYTKGWPASTTGLLLRDDQIEIITSLGSELKILTDQVDSDAMGRAYLQFSPPVRGTLADNAPIIIHQPMGRFIYTGESVGWDNDPGFFTSASCDFEEACGL